MAGQREEGALAETWPGGACHSSLTSKLLLRLGWAELLAAAVHSIAYDCLPQKLFWGLL